MMELIFEFVVNSFVIFGASFIAIIWLALISWVLDLLSSLINRISNKGKSDE